METELPEDVVEARIIGTAARHAGRAGLTGAAYQEAAAGSAGLAGGRA